MKEGKKAPKLRFKGFTDDWEQRKLGDVADRVTRKNKGTVSELPLTISAQDGLISQDEFFNKKVASKDLSSYLLLHHGDFAYNKSYSNGYPFGTIKRLEKYPQGVVSSLYIAFKPNSRISSDFMAQYYESNNWHKEIYKCAAEGARNHGLLNVPPSDFFATDLNIPIKKSEQLKIGRLLNAVDHTITLHEEKQRQLERLKKALLEKMFRDETGYPILRFKGFNNVWKQRKLGEVSSLRGRIGFRGYKQTDLVEKGKGAITFSPSDIDANGNISFLNNKYISIRKYEESPEIQVNTGDILFTKTASIGKIGYVKKLNEKATINPQIALLTPKIDFNGYFIFLSIRNDAFMRKVQKIVGGSSVPTMSQEKLKNLTINFPSSIEQHKLANIFLKIDGLITLHQHKIDNLKHLKRALLQKMFV